MLHNRDSSSHRFHYIALFAAFSMFAATLEYLFPRPVPFFRLGLANLPIILAFPLLDFPGLVLLTLLKVLGQALINGTLASYVFLLSLVGSFASFLLMYGLYRAMKSRFSYIGLSLAGALASNSVQSLFSVLVIFGQQAWVILPLFYGLGFAAGLIIGVLAEIISRHSLWFYQQYLTHPAARRRLELNRHFRAEESAVAGDPETDTPSAAQGNGSSADDSATAVTIAGQDGESGRKADPRPRRRRRKSPVPAFLKSGITTPGAFIAGVLSLPFYLLVTDPLARFVQVVLLGILALGAGKRLFYAYFFFLLLSVTFFHVLIPQGRVLLEIGSLHITEGALMSGLYRGLTIIGLVFISLFSIRKDLYIPGKFGSLVSRTLQYFEHIYEYRKSASLHGLVARIDSVLFDLSGNSAAVQTAGDTAPDREKFRARDLAYIIPIICLMALPLIYQILHSAP